MKPRLLLASTELPTVGGSSTASYALFRGMLADGHDAHYVNLIDQDDAAYYRFVFAEDLGNPERLPHVRPCWLRGSLTDPHPELNELVAAIDPDIAIGFGFLATLLLTSVVPARRTVFVTGTCRQAQDHVTSGRAEDAISLERALATSDATPRVVNDAERKAVERCDLVVTHSAMTLDMMERFFAPSIGKIYPTFISKAEWICADAAAWRHHARPFDERDIDVLFIASEWERTEKNYSMVKAIAARLADASVHIVGEVPRIVPSATHHGFIASRERLFELMGRARSVACPSRIDAAPGVIFEASIMGCNVVASRNCGNWELCHPALLADPYGPDAFVACIGRARARKHADHLDRFLERPSYRELMAVLTALAHPFATQAAR